MSNTANGGIWALAGYLYQIVGTLSITAHAFDSTTSSVNDLDDIDVLLNLLDVGEALEAHPERYEQDAILRDQFAKTDKCVIVQFKYSVSSRKIDKPELRSIIDKLDESVEEATSRGHDVTACVLITNREFTSRGGAAKQYWEEQEGRERGYQLRHVDCSLEDWMQRLRRFGRAYGAFDHEMERGISELVGTVFRETGEQRFDASVIREDLIKAFTGYRHATPLTYTHLSEVIAQELDEFSERLGLQGHPVRRQSLEEIGEAIIGEERALVILEGVGGCGKTVALWQWAQKATTTSAAERGAYAAISPANEARRSWVAELVCKWGNLPEQHPRHFESNELALKRLLIANRDWSPVILHLGLDGLDEEFASAEQEQNIRDIVRWFWNEDKRWRQELRERPRAVLLVTCRDAKDVVEKWLRLDLSGFGYQGIQPRTVEIEEFSWIELKTAVNKNLSKISDKLEGIIGLLIRDDAPDDSMYAFQPPLFGAVVPVPSAVDEDVLKALRHPAMWRAFLEFEPVSQLHILDGEPELVGELAGIFVKRFCVKLATRGRAFRFTEEDLLRVLHSIAVVSRDNGHVRQSRSDWVDWARGTSFRVEPQEARGLYDEALSGGLITEDDPKHWRWRHGLVWKYLAEIELI